MNYTEAIAYIHSTPKFSRVLGNDMLKRLLFFLGDPHKKLKYIHIAGTNGKGSAAKMLSAALTHAGYTTGLFISPYIERFNERISVNGADIADDELAQIVTAVRDAIEKHDAPVSEFALDTACAFIYFTRKKCDIVVLETGLGGRLDATNVIDDNLVSLFMKIGLDHMQYLGDTVDRIAEEKCAIMKPGAVSVSAPNQPPEAMRVIEKSALETGNTLIKTAVPEYAEGGFVYKGSFYKLSLAGAYQPENAAAVLETLAALEKLGFPVPEETIRKTLATVKWQARFEYLSGNIILDGAHNIDGIRALKQSLFELKHPVRIFAAMMEDKAWEQCLAEIMSAAEHIYACETDMPRCLKKERIAELAEDLGVPCTVIFSPKEALDEALRLDKLGITSCFCGSLYFAGSVRREWNKRAKQ